MKKAFNIPFPAKACAILPQSRLDLPAQAYAYKVTLKPLKNPEAFATKSRLTWSVSLDSLYRYSEELFSHKTNPQAYFELPDKCDEVVVEAIPWRLDKLHEHVFDFELVVYGDWEGHNVVTVYGEEK